MKRCLTIALVLALGGCAAQTSTEAQRRSTTPTEEVRDALAEAEGRARAERERVREMQAQLALSQAEAEELRDEVRALRAQERRRATRISESCAEPSPDQAPVAEVSEPAASEPRPVLRLYGPNAAETAGRPAMSTRGVSAIPGPAAPAVVAPPPQGGARLPVFAVGGDPESVPSIPAAPVAVAGEPPVQPTAAPLPGRSSSGDDDGAVREYRRALSHLTERRLDEAMAGLDAFIRAHPRHPYADNAMFWRAEILYTRRDFSRALAAYSELIASYPRGNKVPDALLKIGFCYERLGRRARARRVFERLRLQYPDTRAARMAAREDA